VLAARQVLTVQWQRDDLVNASLHLLLHTTHPCGVGIGLLQAAAAMPVRVESGFTSSSAQWQHMLVRQGSTAGSMAGQKTGLAACCSGAYLKRDAVPSGCGYCLDIVSAG
jgi:hypothetical protein